MSDDHAPELDKATRQRWVKRLKTFSWVTGSLAVVACVAGVLIAALLGQWVLALLIFGLTLFWTIPFGQKLFVTRLVPRATVDSTGTTLRPGRSVDLLGAAVMLIGLTTGAAWATLGVLGHVTFPFPAKMSFQYPILFGAFAAFCGAYLVTMIKNSGTAYVRLSPDGFAFAEGFHEGQGSWADAVAVNDDTPVYPVGFWIFKTQRAQPFAWCAITITKKDGTMAAVPNGNLYAANGDALRGLIQFYWQHPDHRVELTDDRALARLAAWEPTAA